MYSMALHGRAELHLAPDEYAGLLMVLLRMLAFRPAGTTPKPVKAAALVRPPAVAKAVVAVPLPKAVAPVAAPVAAPAPVVTAPAPVVVVAPVVAPVTSPVAAPVVAAPAPVASHKASEPVAPSFGARLRPRPVEQATVDDEPDFGDGPPPDDAPPPWMEADDAPSTAAAAPDAREPDAPRRIELRETPEGAQWAERIAAANILGMTGELARQAQALSRRIVDGREVWTLRVERESLRAPALVAKLEAALDAKLDIEAGVAEDSIALRTVARAEAQQRTAEDLAAAHPMTRTLLSQFPSARILPGSVQPVLTPST